ncbi:hypothetical protein CFK38_13250 [Brachybacterium vulturis]|uniref:WXG100 family type VII secretion target n=1 Tax=Brachybacterium vulturis TaxID=2017484 RepID=A0A291GQA8_9MICO|nr:hypothetical protein [Brachybacterium vulturis]ATG52378.1 hypothetical protein CFK38_13250 [Brachybacterium vulturis]
MNTFWGCETERLTELSTVVDARAERLRALIQQVALCTRITDWCGPDAEEHRRRTLDLVEFVIDLIERLRELGELLGQEAAEQDLCSQAEGSPARSGVGDPLGVRATPPWILEDFDHLPDLSGPPAGDPVPGIGVPIMAEDPFAFPKHRPELPDGEDFALDPEILAEAERQRKGLLGDVPIVGIAQTLMSGHEAIGEVYDRVETTLVDNGYGAFTPLVSLARVPHDLSGVMFGEKSVLGQVTSAVDRGLANVAQTGGEVLSEIGEGDAGGAVRALERGLFRNAGMSADLLTATAAPAIADTASDLIGTGADLTEPFSPGSAETLRTVEESLREVGQGWEQTQEELTDPEFYYDLRRTYAPMPWDPQA